MVHFEVANSNIFRYIEKADIDDVAFAFRLKIVYIHITKGKRRAAKFAVSTDVRCKSPEWGGICSAKLLACHCLTPLIRSLRNDNWRVIKINI